VTQQARFDVLCTKGFLQQRVVLEINHAHGQVVGRTPIGVKVVQLLL
jgi:hypothetical protein